MNKAERKAIDDRIAQLRGFIARGTERVRYAEQSLATAHTMLVLDKRQLDELLHGETDV